MICFDLRVFLLFVRHCYHSCTYTPSTLAGDLGTSLSTSFRASLVFRGWLPDFSDESVYGGRLLGSAARRWTATFWVVAFLLSCLAQAFPRRRALARSSALIYYALYMTFLKVGLGFYE